MQRVVDMDECPSESVPIIILHFLTTTDWGGPKLFFQLRLICTFIIYIFFNVGIILKNRKTRISNMQDNQTLSKKIYVYQKNNNNIIKKLVNY